MLAGWQSLPERAPSEIRADKPTIARTLALIGFFLIAVGAIAMAVPLVNEGRDPERRWSYIIGPTWGLVFATGGLALILFHAFADWEVQFRRLYGFFAIVLLLGGAILRIIPIKTAGVVGVRELGAWFLPYGVPMMALAFILMLAVLRHETDAFWHALLMRLLGAFGVIMILAGVGVGLAKADFVPGEGIVLILMGTMFLTGFIGMQGIGSDVGHYFGLALGFLAVGVFSLAVLRSVMARDYFIPSGLTLMGVSVLHFALALGICSDHPFVVLARRELAAFFYSPIAYIVLFVSLVVSAILFYLVVASMIIDARMGRGEAADEPIVFFYLGNAIPVIIQMIVVPVITMRLVSEEKRSGTLEMLLTAPVNEVSVVLAKFVAAWIFWLITWLPYFLFLVGLRVVGGEEFDYRPLLAFALALAAAGGGFIAMGLFFSSVTQNQIIAAVLTFVGMMVHLSLYMAQGVFDPGSVWREIFTYASFFDLWRMFLQGNFAPRYLVFHLAAMVFFLYLSVKVLEARKWK
jgi:ABC-type transport system involved in multi-copper enzyme maturation permease subunit